MKILWYWPFAHRGESPTAVHTARGADELTVLCLRSFAGETLGDAGARYRVVRRLPDVRRDANGKIGKAIDRVKVHATRTWRRHRLVVSECVDVVHLHMAVPLLDVVAIPALRRHAPVVLHVHDVVPHRYRVAPVVERWLLGRTYRSCDRLIVFHDVLGDRLVREFDVDRERIEVVPLPIDAELLPPRDRADAHVLFFGSFRTNKGLPELIEVAPKLADVAEVRIVGSGEPELEALVHRAAEAGGNVIAEIGYATAERKAELHRWASVVVLPYRDGFASQSAVLFDAYVAAVPVVATDVGALGPTVAADGSGVVVPPGDAGALADAIRTLVTDEARWQASVNAIVASREAHRPVHIGPRYRAMYTAVVRGRLGEADGHAVTVEGEPATSSARSLAVVIPVFDNVVGLGRAVAALDRQEQAPDEVVIVDDGSTDGTGAVADRLVADRPGWRVVHVANGGPSAARNAGVLVTSSDAVTFLDANDEPEPTWTTHLLALLGPGVALAGCGVRWIGADREQLLGADGVVGLPGSFALRRTLFDAVGGYDEVLRFGENTDLVARAERWCREVGVEAASTGDLLLVVNDPSPDRRHDRARLAMVEHVLERDRALLVHDRARRAQLEGIGAVIAARLGSLGRARRLAWAALRSQPANPRGWARVVALVVPGGARRWASSDG